MKPMLAAAYNPDKAKWPLWASVKIDGLRCIIRDGVALSRSLKPLPNEFLQAWVREHATALEGLDGELVVDDPTAPDVFRVSSGALRRKSGEPDFQFLAFDMWNMRFDAYRKRYTELLSRATRVERVQAVESTPLGDAEALKTYLEHSLAAGWEGVMLRDPNTQYKLGRATVTKQELLKVKTFVDDEFEIVGVQEEMHNENEAVTNALGHTERSSHKENKTGKGTLGALVCRMTDGTEFKVGTGFDQKTREALWTIRDTLPGKLAKIKYFPEGSKERPRFPVYLGLRAPFDMGE